MRGYKPGRFSFNVKGGRCEACKGDGYNTIEMQFPARRDRALRGLPRRPLQTAKHWRFRYKDHTIADVLNLTVDEAAVLFEANPGISRKLNTLQAVGLGYIRLGQPATTLSGGEAQASQAEYGNCRNAQPDAPSICWTNRLPDSPSTMLRPCLACCSDWSTVATRSS